VALTTSTLTYDDMLHIASFGGQQGRISRPVRAGLHGQSGQGGLSKSLTLSHNGFT